MKQNSIVQTGVALMTGLLMLSFGIVHVQAHGGEEHDEESEEVVSEDHIAEMEKMIGLMNQLVALLTTLRSMPAPVTSAMPAPGYEHVDEMEVHHDEHAVETDEDAHDEHEEDAEVARLVIELEPHNNQTHAHVRYVDKPEEMFFIEPSLSDEEGIVTALVARTGLTADVVRSALKYMQ